MISKEIIDALLNVVENIEKAENPEMVMLLKIKAEKLVEIGYFLNSLEEED